MYLEVITGLMSSNGFESLDVVGGRIVTRYSSEERYGLDVVIVFRGFRSF